MFKCCECGHLFEDGEQAVWTEAHGEKWSGCPICNAGYEEVHQCKECDEWHTEDELYDGWCEKCLRDTINYDTFFEYCEANKDDQYLDIFVMSEFLGMDVPNHSSDEFHKVMVKIYKGKVKSVIDWEKMTGRKSVDDFLPACIRFIMDDDGSIGRENYADWLNKREAK